MAQLRKKTADKKLDFENLAVPAVLWALGIYLYVKHLAVPIYVPDFWWHLNVGGHMIKNSEFLRTDIFSHTMAGVSWINFEWLSQVILYLVVKWFGLKMVFFGKILLSLSSLAFLIISLRVSGARGPWLFLLAWLGFMGVRQRFLARPELLTLNFFPIFVSLFLFARSAPAGVKKILPWILFGMGVFWINAHAGLVYGLGVAVLFNLGARLAGEKKDYIRFLDLTVLLLTVSFFLTPAGPKLLVMFSEVSSQLRKAPNLIMEWLPPRPDILPVFWTLFLLAIGFLGWSYDTNRKRMIFWLPAVLVFGIYGCLAYRNTALFPFVALPFVAEMLMKLKMIKASSSKHAKRIVTVGWLLCLVPLTVQSKVFVKPFPEQFVRWSSFPVGAVDFVLANDLKGRMYNTYAYGGYIGFRLGMKKPVFMDGRYLFYPFLVEKRNLIRETKDNFTKNRWQPFFDKHRVDYAIVQYPTTTFLFPKGVGPPFSLNNLNVMFPRSAWMLIYWDDQSLIFHRRGSYRGANYPSLWPYNTAQMKYLLDEKILKPALVRRELRRHKELVGPTRKGREMAAIVADL